jgi:hypothetical protein
MTTPRADILFILYTRHYMALVEYENAIAPRISGVYLSRAKIDVLNQRLYATRRELDEAVRGISDDYPALINQRAGYFKRFLYALRRNFR